MSNVIDHLVPEIALEGESPIYKMACDLDDFLSEIAFAEGADNKASIRRGINCLRRRYSELIKAIGPCWDNLYTPLGLAVSCVYNAFIETCLSLDMWLELTPEERRDEAEKILAENRFTYCDVELEEAILKLERRNYMVETEHSFGLEGLCIILKPEKL